jgi:hypothetical protein
MADIAHSILNPNTIIIANGEGKLSFSNDLAATGHHQLAQEAFQMPPECPWLYSGHQLM